MMMKRVSLLMSLFMVLSAVVPRPAAGQEQQKKQINDPAEYNAYVAALNETTPAKKLQMLDEFLAKYPNTVVKEDALELKMVTMQQAGQSPEPAARQLLQVTPNNLRALVLVCYIFVQTPLSPTDPAFNKKLAEAEQMAQRGLQALPSFQPPNVTGAELEKTKKVTEATFRETLGLVAIGRKQYEAAQNEFRKATDLAPDNATLFYRLGNAYISERPNPRYAPAFWAFARAATLDGPGALAPAGRQQVEEYLKKVYVQYHGSEEGLAELKGKAKAEPYPPADFKVLSKAEILPPVEKMDFSQLRAHLSAGGPQAEKIWKALQGKSMSLEGLVLSTAPATRPRTIRLILMQDTAQKQDAYDVEMSLGAPFTGRLEVGQQIQFEGLANSFQPNPFVLSLVDGKITGGATAPAAKKTPAAKKPVRKRR